MAITGIFLKKIVRTAQIGQCSDMSANMLTPNAAAKAVGTSRSAIMRALANRTLPAQRDNKNRWLISRADLDAWAAMRPERDRAETITDRTVIETNPDMFAQLSAVQADLAASRAETAGLRDRLADTQAERDRLAALLDRALEPRPGIFRSLFRR